MIQLQENRRRIQQASRRLRIMFQTIVWLLPVINAVFWFNMNHMPDLVLKRTIPFVVSFPLPFSALFLGFLVTMLPIGASMIGIHYLKQLFGLYEREQFFQMGNVLCFKKIARVLIWLFLTGIVSNSLLSIALTLQNPPGHRLITIELSSNDLTVLLLGLILAVISWVMEEGRKLQEEQDLTV